jgi:hypothetical protein
MMTPKDTPELTSRTSLTSANQSVTILITKDLADNTSPNQENITLSSTITRFYDTL